MDKNARVQTIVTGLGWMGSGIRSIDAVMHDLIISTKRELIIVAFSITGGAKELFNLIQEKLEEGVQVKILLNRFMSQSKCVKEEMLSLKHNYSYLFRIFDFSDIQDTHLHAKVIITDRKKAVVGSANLSWHGLVTNHELCVLIEGDAVLEISQAVDQLLQHKLTIEVD